MPSRETITPPKPLSARRKETEAPTAVSRRRWALPVGVLILCVLMGLGFWGFFRSSVEDDSPRFPNEDAVETPENPRTARSMELAQQSLALLEDDSPALALEIARAAVLVESSSASRDALRLALNAHRERLRVPGRALAVSPDGRHVFLEMAPSSYAIQNLDSPSKPDSFGVVGDNPQVVFTPDGEHVVVLTSQILMLNDLTGRVLTYLPAPTFKEPEIELSSDGTRLLVVGGATLELFAISARRPSIRSLRRWQDRERCATSPCLTRSRGYLLLLDDRNTPQVFDLSSGDLVAELAHDGGERLSASLSESGVAVTTRRGSEVRVWSGGGTLLFTLSSDRIGADGMLLSEGKYLTEHGLLGSSREQTFELPFEEGDARDHGVDSAPRYAKHIFWPRLYVAPKEGVILTRDPLDDSVRFWKRDRSFVGHTGGPVPEHASFRSDGAYVAFWSDTANDAVGYPISVWSARGELQFTIPDVHSAEQVVIDEDRLVVVRPMSTRVYALESSKLSKGQVSVDILLSMAEKRSTHTLTEAERARYDLEGSLP